MNNFSMKAKLGRFISVFMMLVMMISCSKERPVQLTDDQKVNLFSKADLEGLQVDAVLDGSVAKQAVKQYEPLQASEQSQRLKIVDVQRTDNDRVKELLLGQWVEGIPGQKVVLEFGFTKIKGSVFLTVSKVIQSSEISSLSVQEKTQLKGQKASGGVQKLVVFNYSVANQGTLDRTTNDLGESTRRVWLKKTDIGEAEYVQLASLAEDRQKVGLSALPVEAQRNIFIKDNLDDHVYPAKYLKDAMGLKLQMADDELVMTSLNNNTDNGNPTLDIFQILDKSELDPNALRALVNSEQTKVTDAFVQYCSAEVAAKAKALKGIKNCVVVDRYYYALTYVSIIPTTDSFTGEVNWAEPKVKNEVNPTDALYVQVDITQKATESVFIGDFNDPSKHMKVTEFTGKEFLFRRTLTDTPNMFDVVFAGLSGELQVVKFVFTESYLEVRRSRPLLNKIGVNGTDEEVLMSFPVTYKRQINATPEGVPLKTPYRVATKFDHPDAIAYVDWSMNRLPGAGSVLAEWGIQAWCFSGRASEAIEEINFNKNAGMFGFTIVQTFNGVNGYCASGLSDDYFDQGASPVQQNFTFRERLSFKEYKGESELKDTYLDIPYETQKRLGFGLFTSYKYKPNKFGNIGYDGTQVATPAVFDLQDKKTQVVYVLSGIPTAKEDPTLRTMLIKATIEGIADINKAFRKAFKGTPMERPDGLLNEVVRLEVEDMTDDEIKDYAGFDVRPTTSGFIGDFDKNYIRYIQKGTKSTIIGLGGAHHNPFSGKVEAASVFIYGGNIHSYVEIIRRREAARAEYRQNLGKPAESVNIITKEERDLAAAEKIHDVTRTIVDLKNPASLYGSTTAKAAENILGALAIGYDPSVLAASAGNKGKVLDALSRLKSGMRNSSVVNQVMQAGTDHAEIERGKDLFRAYRSLMDESVKNKKSQFSSPRMLEAKLNPAKSDAAKFEELVNKMESKNYCLHELDALSSVTFKNGIPDDVTDNDIAVAIYKPTLVHEIGHNLGLRHNFIASFDKANWKFDKNEVTKRDYTSVMDYTPNDHETYDGMGPYDVHALRAAYTGYLELDNDALNKSDVGPRYTAAKSEVVTRGLKGDVSTKVIVGDGGSKLISVDDFKRAAGINSWIELNTDSLKKVGLRNYMFCSDEDAGESPTCNRHDLGSTPEEIVDHIIKDYKELYSMNNLRNDRLLYRRWNNGNYIGRLMMQFGTARMFLEEAIYRLAFLGEDFQTEVMPYFNAAIKAYDFFQEVIRQPDATVEEARSGDRFVKLKVNKEDIIVEKKAIRDIDHDNVNYFDLAVKGVEFDKVIALIQLTSRDNSSFRYSGRGLVFSYYTLEGWLYGDNLASSSKILQILSEMLADDITPAARGAKNLVNLPAKFKVDSTLMMQYYSALAGSLFLDITQGRNNPADMFRVFVGFNPPAARPSIVPPGLGQDDLKYYTTSGSLIADKLITNAATIIPVATNKTLQKALPQWFILRKVVEAERAAAKTPAPADAATPATPATPSKSETQLAQLEAQLKTVFKTFPAFVPNTNLDQLYAKVGSFLNTVAAAEKLKADASKKDLINDWVAENKSKMVKNAYTDPLFVYTFLGLTTKDFGLTLIDSLKIETSEIDYNLDTKVDSIQYLSQFFYSFNPQYVGQR